MNIGMTLIPEFEDLYNQYAYHPQKIKYLEIEGIAPKDLDMGLSSLSFFDNKLSDISSDGNANWASDISPSVYRTHTTNAQMKLLGYHLLWYHSMKKYGRDFADKAISMIWDGSLYFHDAHGIRIQMPYCYAFSLDKIVYEGRPYGSSPNTPPKNKKAYISQVDKLISDLSKQFAGATAPSDFFLWYSWYFKQWFDREYLTSYDTEDGANIWNRNIDEIKKEFIQDMQGLVVLFNEPGRAEGEPPFTNISIFDGIGLEALFGHIIFPDKTKPDMDLIMWMQRTFCEWFNQGDPITGFPYRFPVVTINMTIDDDKNFIDDRFAKWVAKTNRPLGNFNLHFGKNGKLAMCCRYENSLDDMSMTPDSFGNGGVNIGSHRVVTPNIPRASLLADGSHEKFITILDDYLDVSAKLLDVHRIDILQRRIEKNPDYLRFFGRLGWFNLDTMFSTIGITGIYEAVQFMGMNILEDDGTDFTLDLMEFIRDKIKGFRHQYQCVFNAEEIPGEQACVTLLKKDKIAINPGDISSYIVYKTFIDCQLYSNQYIPLINDADLVNRLDLSGRFMSMISGGGIVHANVESPIDSDGKMYELMKLASKSGVPHMAVCYRFGKCADHKATIIGQGTTHCPICGEPIVHTRARVIGYFSDEFNWNATRKIHDAPHRYYSDMKEVE